MVVKKAGTILLDLNRKKIALIYRKEDNGYTLPKGHLEDGETLEECAVRETEEETLNKNHILVNKPLGIVKYQNIEDGDVEVHYFLAASDGLTDKNILDKDKEIYEWVDFDEVELKLNYKNLLDFWISIKDIIKKVLENKNLENIDLLKFGKEYI